MLALIMEHNAKLFLTLWRREGVAFAENHFEKKLSIRFKFPQVTKNRKHIGLYIPEVL